MGQRGLARTVERVREGGGVLLVATPARVHMSDAVCDYVSAFAGFGVESWRHENVGGRQPTSARSSTDGAIAPTAVGTLAFDTANAQCGARLSCRVGRCHPQIAVGCATWCAAAGASMLTRHN